MNFILEGRTGTGFTVSGESVMIDRYGDVYPTIDNVMHPNPGTEADGYSEIERCIDWLLLHDFKAIIPSIKVWISIRVALELEYDLKQTAEEIIHNVFFDDAYQLSTSAKDITLEIIKELKKDPKKIETLADQDEIESARDIAEFINERFLRVRAGGKLNPEGADAIYFRISSHGYDWRRVIENFLWDVFKDPKKMPREINILHDAETNPPEVFLYKGTPEDLFEKYDSSVFESTSAKKGYYKTLLKEDIINWYRACAKLNKNHIIECRHHGILYKPYK